MDLFNVYSEIKNLVLECGKIITDVDYDNLDIHSKDGINNLVTDYDVTIQEKLKKGLLEIVPEAGFIGEENDCLDNVKNEYVFVVDPIDGTINFTRGLNMSAISVALLHEGKPIIGVCYNPYSLELFEAMRGYGAYLNNKKIHVSDKSLKEGIVLCGCAPYYEDLRSKSLDIISNICMKASDFRRFGSAVIEICNVASGKAELYFELKLMPWDYAAASLILEEAGGVITTIDGSDIQYFEPTSVIVSNGVEDYLNFFK